MKYRAVLKQSEGWWIGWLVDLPGVNAQEKTQEECLESLRIGAEDMLTTPIECGGDTVMKYVEVSERATA